jgi:hypothetical protein
LLEASSFEATPLVSIASGFGESRWRERKGGVRVPGAGAAERRLGKVRRVESVV